MTRTFRGTALAVIAPAVLAVVLAGCSDKKDDAGETAPADRPTVEVTAQPQDPQTAQVTAEQVFDNLSDGDWAGAWELWTDTAQSALAKDVYVDLVSTCTALQGDYVVTGLTPVDDSTATVKWTRTPTGGTATSGTNTIKYQNGHWRFEPDPTALAAFKQNKCP
ncbi:hypothetical protein Daura_07310 [Dactylosporangium aurantiacum]|uniref:Lipoprotein n=1 Tax=Dactylosporangium aurantiacum TaxID=35754 RepID=A0A9Q9IN38_9ACTN|nr:hypothetical protein [Dactylosporangium aurantiacum]MDG6105956.1 hypothetical protein [Dactylosporangium aurantiacum]UWZ55993.1 hypothetical protein Daura_07310 [Dactylosporangium aurantiacum]